MGTKVVSLPATPLPRGTLQDHVYSKLSDLILNGEIAPGQLVTIQALSDAFGVSTMPVREALQRLTAAKALTVISGRSIGIPRLTAERLLDLRRVRLEVEGLAAEWAVEHVSRDTIASLERTVEALGEAEARGDVKAYLRANREFHFTIYKAAASDVLYALIESLWLQISPFFHLLHGSGNYTVANAQHELMLRALKARDRAGVRQGIRNDIEAASNVLLAMLNEHG
ncbi:MAG: GntR family transcriptional regulator [Methylobacteriaceae bacterium]|nr:GntR family transcriptional regulator [Methylobacteriaceae bacterium]